MCMTRRSDVCLERGSVTSVSRVVGVSLGGKFEDVRCLCELVHVLGGIGGFQKATTIDGIPPWTTWTLIIIVVIMRKFHGGTDGCSKSTCARRKLAPRDLNSCVHLVTSCCSQNPFLAGQSLGTLLCMSRQDVQPSGAVNADEKSARHSGRRPGIPGRADKTRSRKQPWGRVRTALAG
jgi:hypothetical protein